MKKILPISLVCLLPLLINACASTPFTQPKREAYTGKDQVTAVNATSFIGSWHGKILNPIQGETLQNVTYRYKTDGTVLMNVDNTNTGNPISDMAIEITGTWQVGNGLITQQAQSIRETSGNKFAGMITGVMNSLKRKMSGSANVYLLEPNRIILVSEDDQHQALELTRI